MTMLERAQAIQKRIQQRAERDRRAQRASVVMGRTGILDSAKLTKARETSVVLLDAGFPVENWPEPPRDSVETYRSKFSVARDLDGTQPEWDAVLRDMKAYVESAEGSLKAAIRKARASLLDAAANADLEGLKGDDETRPVAEKLSKSFADLSAKKWEKLSAAELDSVLKSGKQFRAGLTELREKGASPEVREFLRLARSAGGAAVERLTDPIRKEIVERGIAKNLKVTFK